MTLATERKSVIGLFLLAAGVSLLGFVIQSVDLSAAARAGFDCFDYSMPRRDLRTGLALLLGALALWLRRTTRAMFLAVGVGYGLLSVLAIAAQFTSQLGKEFFGLHFALGAAIFGVAAVACWKGKAQFIPLFSLVYVGNEYLFWHLRTVARVHERSSVQFDDPPTVLADMFELARWWHLVLLALFGVLFLWAVKFCWDSARELTEMRTGGAARVSRVRGTSVLVLANAVWLAAAGLFVQVYNLTGLTPILWRLGPNVNFEEKLLATIPAWRWYTTPILRGTISPGSMPVSNRAVFSPDVNGVAYLEKHWNLKGITWSVACGEKKGPEFDEIGDVLFNSEGSRLAYTGRRGKSWYAFIDGKEGPAFEEIFYPSFSPDGKQFIYRGKRNGKWAVVNGDDVSTAFDEAWGVFFTKSGRIAYAARKGGRRFLVVEGRPVVEVPAEFRAVLPWGSEEFGYIGLRGYKQFLFFGGKKGPEFDEVGYPALSPDGKTVAYQAERAGEKFVVAGDKEIKFRPCSDPQFSPDGRLTFLGCKGASYFLVVDGQPWPGLAQGTLPMFSPDGRRIAYTDRRNQSEAVVVDGMKGPVFERVLSSVKFSANGEAFAYVARQTGKNFVVVGERRGPGFEWVGEPKFSADGKHVAYKARHRYREFIVVDEKPGPSFDWVSVPVFNANGTKLAYAAQDGRRLWRKAMDAR